ncbi:N-formylglutamate deformylase [Aliikangiella sp. IMCC44359]|uniref:N-formylglutamate deformylase n=1 Tax=Aliikangiella sp. IMCC44359 TaxID=3459125 RepID=UPI00403B1D48
MSKIFELIEGKLPILVSMPHNGSVIPDDIAVNMNQSALASVDTDWYMDKVYQFTIQFGCSLIKPFFSRYVIDLNRSDDDVSLYPGANTTELCPTTQFDLQPIYQTGKSPTQIDISQRIEKYWRPYHEQLARSLMAIKSQYGYALLFEAHSIRSIVPRFFSGQLPDFNFGNNDETSSCLQLTELIKQWQPVNYSKVFNARFKGGYITRHYGNPSNNIDSLQLELSQATYMNEQYLTYDNEKAEKVINEIKGLFERLKILCLQRSESV